METMDTENFYYDESDDNVQEDDAVMSDIELDNSLESKNQNYAVLKESQILGLIDDEINKVCGVLNVPSSEATTLLLRHNWDASKVHDRWFEDEAELLGNQETRVSDNRHASFACGICFESYDSNESCSLVCGHRFCRDCWVSYISMAIKDGSVCLCLRCPEPSCHQSVPGDLVNAICREEDKKKYTHCLVASYVEENKKKIKWCPAPDCVFAVEFVPGSDSENGLDVLCKCSHKFCWNCLADAHRPVHCDMVAKWNEKNSSEAGNTQWILSFTKPCPKCKKPIEKNQGCNHMRCLAPCSFQFCWYCLQPWPLHDPIACLQFQRFDDELNESKDKTDVLRYMHFFERAVNNKRSMHRAKGELKKVCDVEIRKLMEIHAKPQATAFDFLIDAWEQIVECRRFLQWSFVYGYYLPEEGTKTRLFEYLQKDAEASLERLNGCAETELRPFLVKGSPSLEDDSFPKFREKLTTLTKVTKTYFKNLATALEDGLSDVGSEPFVCEKKKSPV